MIDRATFLSALIGRPYAANAAGPEAFDCWHLAVHVERVLFGRKLPDVVVPDGPTRRWIMEEFRRHREAWRETGLGPMGLVTADDGAVVLMAAVREAIHCGVWLEPEQRVIHADMTQVRCEDLPTLRANGWARLRFFEPAGALAA